MCPAMWRLTFSGGGHLVRLSANGCQPHRPNTALLFCAAGYRPGLLLLSWLFYGNKKHSQNGTGKKLEIMAFISIVLADFISLLAGAIQQKPVIPAFRGA